MKKLRVDVWSDIACPWCYVGKRHLEAALQRFPERDEVDVIWRSFELDPSAPREVDDGLPYAERLAQRHRVSRDKAAALIEQMTKLAAADGLELRFDLVKPGNTFDAHRILHLARERGKQAALEERLLHAYFTEGEAIGRLDTLTRLATDAGLEPDEVRSTLTSDAFAEDVREDELEATELGITGVPFFVVAGRYAISGAQPADAIVRTLDRGWREVVGSRVA